MADIQLSFQEVKIVDTFNAMIHMAGDIDAARQFLRKHVTHVNRNCVQLYAADYIYTGGMESGFVVRLINYPRFERTSDVIAKEAKQIAASLAAELSQISFTIETPVHTGFYQLEGFNKAS